MTTNVVHAKIEDAITNKKSILESATDTIRILKQFEEFKKIREGKVKTQQKFIESMEKISNLITKLETKDLPEIEIEEETPEEVTAPKKVKITEMKKAKKETTITEQLNKELQDIQDKIKSLKI